MNAVIMENVTEIIDSSDGYDQEKIYSTIRSLEKGDFETAYVKNVQYPIRELRVRDYRFLFFIELNSIYFVRGFRKRTPKTPPHEIDMAMKMHRLITKSIWSNK